MTSSKTQRRYVSGALYSVVGASKKQRKLAFVSRFKINGKEYLIFKEQRAAPKTGYPLS